MRKTLYQIAESVIATPQAGLYLDETNISFEMICQKIHEARGIVAQQRWMKDKTVHPDWLQRFYPEFNEVIQEEKCFLKFKCPGFIFLDQNNDGLRYAGSRDYADDFRRIRTRGELSDMKRHPVMNSGRRNYILYEAGELEAISKTKPIDFMTVGVHNDPTEIPTYNAEKDPYPIDAGATELIESMVRNIVIISEKTPADTVSNSKDDKK